MFNSGIADEAGQPIEVQIKAHKELGWRHIEIRNVEGVNLTDLPDEKFDQVYEKVTAAGLTVSCFASQICNWSRPITNPFEVDVEELKRAIPRMKRFGTKFIRIMSYPNDKDNPLTDEAWRDEAVRRIRELAKMSEDAGIVLGHENCNGYGGEGAPQGMELLKRVDSPALKWIFDTGNPVHHGQDAWAYYQGVKEHVVYVHIKDGKTVDGQCQWCYCGEGEGQVQRIVSDLVKSGYDGGFSIEPHLAAIVHTGKTATPEELYQSYLEYGRRAAAIVQKAG